jgi:hypothetical protein
MIWELPTFKQTLQWPPRYHCLATASKQSLLGKIFNNADNDTFSWMWAVPTMHWSHVEAGSNTFTVTLWVVGGVEKGTQCLGYNRTTLFLGICKYGELAIQVGGVSNGLESETVTCGYESSGTRIWEWLRWRGPATIVNYTPILSSERMLHKEYNRKCSVGKHKFWSWASRGLSPRRTNWR